MQWLLKATPISDLKNNFGMRLVSFQENIDALKYMFVVLGLIFLKKISDRFEAKNQELVAEGDGFKEDKDEYMAEYIFFALKKQDGTSYPPLCTRR